MRLESGTRLGSYEIAGPLGAGGMGEVYRAKDHRLGREVALKVLPANVASSPERLARFEREARTVAGLNHPNIVTLFSVEDQGGMRFLTMELVEGQALTDVIPPGGLPLSELLDLALPLTDALVAAHERGVIHRDLKPGNVMVTRDRRVKVLDFGLAKIVREDAADQKADATTITVESPVSSAGRVMGTVPYMAPEQLLGEKSDARSDLFSLGIMLYELASGRRPFTGDTSIDVSHAILRDTPPSLARVRADLPADLARIVDECLEKNPRERTQTALDVSNALRRLRKTVESGGAASPPREHVASIAVLPFENRSGSADDDYFVDGLADELLNVLAKIKGLRVIARTSASAFKSKSVTVPEIARALNVATVLEGSVRKAGNRIRVSVQLVQASDSSHLWSETYDRTLEDVFAVQDDIAHAVVKELRSKLLGEAYDTLASGQARAEVARAARGRTKNPDAQRLYLQAQHLFVRVATHEDLLVPMAYLKKALALDPGFALAWTELSRAYRLEAKRGWVPLNEGYARARMATEQALSLEPDLAEGYAELGRIQTYPDWNLQAAKESYSRALELEPGNPVALRGASTVELYLGHFEKVVELNRRALEEDPLSAGTYHNIGGALVHLHRFAEAEEALRKALEIDPLKLASRSQLAKCLAKQGRGEEALIVAAQERSEFHRTLAQLKVHEEMGHREEADRLLREMMDKQGNRAAFQYAELYSLRGEADLAFEWLDVAYAERDAGLLGLNNSEELRPLHKDPRWTPLLKKMGLEKG